MVASAAFLYPYIFSNSFNLILNCFQSGKACLGDDIYRYLTADQFSSESLFHHVDLSSEHRALETVNRIEAAVHVWKQKDLKKHINDTKSRRTWGGKVRSLVTDVEKNHSLIQRAETLLLSLKLRFPGLPQTSLDMNKIQYNKVMWCLWIHVHELLSV